MMPSAGHSPSSAPSPSLASTPATMSSMKGVKPDQSFPGAILTAASWWRVMTGLSIAAFLLVLVCLQLGTQYIGLGQMAEVFLTALSASADSQETSLTASVILLQVRLPRVLLGFLVGSCLASVGVALQALLRNPLADPYVLGVSSGAALGVAVAVLFGIGTTVLALSVLPVCGFMGGLLALLVIYRMASTYDRLPIHSVLLAGVILNAIFSALITTM